MHILGTLGALALGSLSLGAAVPPPANTIDRTVPSPFRGSFEVVPQIMCGNGSGSGVRISDDVIITAAHVASKGGCSIDGHPATIAFNQPHRDFTAMTARLGNGYRATYSCEGIKPGERYQAFGYALGGKPNVEPLLGTNFKHRDGTVMLRGKVYPGMSGGAVFNSEGAFVAITVMTHREADWAYVIPLTESYLCQS
jgi:hypothetical protein